jgi:hypothetical protein
MCVAVVGAVALAVLPAGAAASVGARVGPARIALARSAAPGRTYLLGPLYLANSGTEPATYNILVQRLRSSERKLVPAGWVVLGMTHVDLDPGRDVNVPVTLRVPPDAPAGDYLTNVLAITTGAGSTESTGAVVGAGAAADLIFTVINASRSGSFPPLGVVAVLLAGTAGILFYASGHRIRLSRRAT